MRPTLQAGVNAIEGGSYFDSYTGANGEKVFTVKDENELPARRFAYLTASATSGAANPIDPAIFGSGLFATTVSGRNVSTSVNIIVETNSLSASNVDCEYATFADATSSGPMKLVIFGNV